MQEAVNFFFWHLLIFFCSLTENQGIMEKIEFNGPQITIKKQRSIKMVVQGNTATFTIVPTVVVSHPEDIEEKIEQALSKAHKPLSTTFSRPIVAASGESYEFAYYIYERLTEAILILDWQINELAGIIDEHIRQAIPHAKVKIEWTQDPIIIEIGEND